MSPSKAPQSPGVSPAPRPSHAGRVLGLALLSLLSLPFTVWVTLMLPNLLLGLWVLVLVREELRGVGWRRGMRAHILLITCAGLIAATTVAAASSPWLGLLSEL